MESDDIYIYMNRRLMSVLILQMLLKRERNSEIFIRRLLENYCFVLLTNRAEYAEDTTE